MARKNRTWFPGAIYHITSRGNRRALIFMDDLDRKMYLKLLNTARETYPFYIHSYCLMPNHIHLLIETINHPPEFFMKMLHQRYVMYFNKRHDFVGHLFQGRYSAQHIDSAKYFLLASKYIHNNPSKANLVDFPNQYHWSSYSSFLGLNHSDLVTTNKILEYFPEPKSENYGLFVEQGGTGTL